jgi:hypothetical protein
VPVVRLKKGSGGCVGGLMFSGGPVRLTMDGSWRDDTDVESCGVVDRLMRSGLTTLARGLGMDGSRYLIC